VISPAGGSSGDLVPKEDDPQSPNAVPEPTASRS
jgi:hypothetical protein